MSTDACSTSLAVTQPALCNDFDPNQVAREVRSRPKAGVFSSFQWSFEYSEQALSTLSKHCPLDLKPLTLLQRLRLARIHYLNISNSIRFALVLFCSGWFLFNSYTILKEYLDHDTIVFLDYQSPNSSKPPAVTFCTHCILCSFSNTSLADTNVQTVMQSNNVDQLVYKPVTRFFAVPGEDVRIDCRIRPRNIRTGEKTINCTLPVIVSMQEGHKCFSYFSDIYGDVRKAIPVKPEVTLRYDQSPQLLFKVQGYFLIGQQTGREKIVNMFGKPARSYTGMYVTLHDPTILPDMYDLSFHQIPMGSTTHISFSKTHQTLQPPPYKTSCYGYKYRPEVGSEGPDQVGEMRNDELVNYQSRGECIQFCMWRALNLDRCANFYSIYTEQMLAKDNIVRSMKLLKSIAEKDNVRWSDDVSKVDVDNVMEPIKFCGRTNDSYYEYVATKQHCLHSCPEACQIETFTDQDIYTESDTSSKREYSFVVIQWATQPVTQIVHRPKFEVTDFLGSLGGHAHIWLGLSVIHILLFALRLIQLGQFHPQTSCCDLVHWWRFWCGRYN